MLRELSDTTKAIVYLGSLLVAVGVGAVAAYQALKDVADAPQNITELQAHLEAAEDQIGLLEGRIEALEQANFVTFGAPILIRDIRQPAVVITRHGDGGNYLSPYQEGHAGLGSFGSTVWTLGEAE